jgi:hypothetical protein
MNHSSQVLNQIICSQRSTYDKTGIGYKSEVTNTRSSSSLEKKVQNIQMRKTHTSKRDQKSKKIIRLQQCIEKIMAVIKTGLKVTVYFVISMDTKQLSLMFFQET